MGDTKNTNSIPPQFSSHSSSSFMAFLIMLVISMLKQYILVRDDEHDAVNFTLRVTLCCGKVEIIMSVVALILSYVRSCSCDHAANLPSLPSLPSKSLCFPSCLSQAVIEHLHIIFVFYDFDNRSISLNQFISCV